MAANVGAASGGVSNHIHCLATELEKLGVNVEFMWRGDRRYPGAADTLAFSASIARSVRRAGAVDVVHTHGADGVIAHRALSGRTASVMTSHGDERLLWDIEREGAQRGEHRLRLRTRISVPITRTPLFSAAVRAADIVIALHDEEARSLARKRQGPIRVIPNGWAPFDTVNDAPVPGRLLYVGTWGWRKGSDVLPIVFAKLRDAVPAARLVLAGPGRAAVEAFRPEDRPMVDARGWCNRSALSLAVQEADVLVMTSRFEGMPLVALDAAAHGLPVVGFDLPGLRALPGGTKLANSAEGPAGLASALQQVILDRGERALLSRDGTRAVGDMTWSATAVKTVDAYEDALRRRRKAQIR